MNNLTNRCEICKKKVGLLGFICKCEEGWFCGEHRYPESHGCTYDYKEEGREMITLKNPVVKGEKLKDRC
ncbi:hypothetical protein SAY87_031175 [Trapa incisa]|uniref:AN1-type domain-containing protein n=1 Tax=Trapa incisa TaxID=236973 RepID=A0AAN7QMS1_9MYRT|nr:hypothetical protein SAY87_031175 [Trapa incisa]